MASDKPLTTEERNQEMARRRANVKLAHLTVAASLPGDDASMDHWGRYVMGITRLEDAIDAYLNYAEATTAMPLIVRGYESGHD